MKYNHLYTVLACAMAIALVLGVLHLSERPAGEQRDVPRDVIGEGVSPQGVRVGLESVVGGPRDPVRLAHDAHNDSRPDASEPAPASPEELSRVQVLNKAHDHTESMPKRSARQQAEAAIILLTVCVTTILDARGEFTLAVPGVPERRSTSDGECWLSSGGRRYLFPKDEFPEYFEIMELLQGRGETAAGVDTRAFGTGLSATLSLQIQLRYEEALTIARSMPD